MITIMTALEREMSQLRKRAGAEKSRFAKGSISGKKVFLVKTGMGKENVENALSELITEHEIETLISTGFAAGVDYKLKVGDLILANQLSTSSKKEAIIPVDSMLFEQTQAILDKVKIDYWVGEIKTCHRVAGKEVKMGFINQKPIGLDMESYWVAKVAEANCIPYLICRVVVDRADDNLPFLVRERREDHPYLAVFPRLLSHPWELVSYLRLAMASRKAANGICQLVTSLIGGLKI